jgi:hypothetical protein
MNAAGDANVIRAECGQRPRTEGVIESLYRERFRQYRGPGHLRR